MYRMPEAVTVNPNCFRETQQQLLGMLLSTSAGLLLLVFQWNRKVGKDYFNKMM